MNKLKVSVQEIRTRVISLMEYMGYEISLSTLPEIREVSDSHVMAVYYEVGHYIEINPSKLSSVEETLAHELVHSLQSSEMLSKDNSKPYIQRECELQAYHIQALYNMHYRNNPVGGFIAKHAAIHMGISWRAFISLMVKETLTPEVGEQQRLLEEARKQAIDDITRDVFKDMFSGTFKIPL